MTENDGIATIESVYSSSLFSVAGPNGPKLPSSFAQPNSAQIRFLPANCQYSIQFDIAVNVTSTVTVIIIRTTHAIALSSHFASVGLALAANESATGTNQSKFAGKCKGRAL